MENSPASLKKSSRKAKGGLFTFGTSPEADWKIILISAMILAASVIALSVFIFIKVGKGEIFVADMPEVQKEKALDTALLKETVLYYQNKALELEKIKSTRIPTADPSL
ncbi:MAG: hypothetical protein Q7R69_01490 [bacterium]|nr:hypothetical protein [bacterium]